MTVMVVKTNNDSWVRFEDYVTVESLFREVEKRHHPIILQKNHFYKDHPNDILECWENISYETAVKISSSPYQIEIYNSYRE